jgi:hypothetical protein
MNASLPRWSPQTYPKVSIFLVQPLVLMILFCSFVHYKVWLGRYLDLIMILNNLGLAIRALRNWLRIAKLLLYFTADLDYFTVFYHLFLGHMNHLIKNCCNCDLDIRPPLNKNICVFLAPSSKFICAFTILFLSCFYIDFYD